LAPPCEAHPPAGFQEAESKTRSHQTVTHNNLKGHCRLLALECPGVADGFQEPQTAELSLDDFVVKNRDTGAVFKALPVPGGLLTLMRNGRDFSAA